MRPRLSLCMIVRDEEEFLPHCLESVAGVVDEIVVVDTGSADQTVAIAHERGARVFHCPWTGDFAAARNLSLERATGDWILWLDGDEALHPADRDRVRGLLLPANVEGYLTTHINYVGEWVSGEVEYSATQRLFRNRPAHRFEGRVHEKIHLPAEHVRPSPLRILHYGYLRPMEGGRNKRERNLHLLLQLREERPDDLMVHFYLGGEYRLQGRWAEAVEAYRRAKPALAGGYLYASKLMRGLAVALISQERYEEALRELAEGLTSFPHFTDLVYLQGVACRALGRLPEAIGHFHQCLAMGPAATPPHMGVDPSMGGWRAHHALGDTFERRGEWEVARRHYTRAWAAGRSQVTLARLAALLLLRLGAGAAEAELVRLAEPDGFDSTLMLAEALAAVRLWEAAARHLERATALARTPAEEPDLPPALRGLKAAGQRRRLCRLEALCRFHQGDYSGALAALEALPEGTLSAERRLAALAAGTVTPARLVAGGGPREARETAARALAAGIDVLTQGLYRRRDSAALQSALHHLLEEVRSLG
ncbi:MAG: glycosyltransferase [Bacillota bacterium]